MKRKILGVILAVAFFVAVGKVGNADYNAEIGYNPDLTEVKCQVYSVGNCGLYERTLFVIMPDDSIHAYVESASAVGKVKTGDYVTFFASDVNDYESYILTREN